MGRVFRLFIFCSVAIGIVFGAPAMTSMQLVESVPVGTHYVRSAHLRTETAWLQLIKSARHEIDVASFYCSAQPGGEVGPVFRALQDASRRGVRVRLLLDSRLAFASRRTVARLSRHVAVAYLRMPYAHGGIMHAKYWVVDGVKAYVGSANLDWRSLHHNHELGVLIDSHTVGSELSHLFDSDWRCAISGCGVLPVLSFDATLPKKVVLAVSPEDAVVPVEQRELSRWLLCLKQARQEVLMQVLTWDTHWPGQGHQRWCALFNAVKSAAARGVQVRLIVSEWGVRRRLQAQITQLQRLPNVVVRYSEVPLWQSNIIPYARVEHMKYMVVDRRIAWVGTGNWQRGYFFNSRNIALILYDTAIARALTAIFWRDWYGPYRR